MPPVTAGMKAIATHAVLIAGRSIEGDAPVKDEVALGQERDRAIAMHAFLTTTITFLMKK